MRVDSKPTHRGKYPGRRLVRTRLLLLLSLAAATPLAGAEWEGYERMTRDQVLQVIEQASANTPPDLYAKNLSELDLSDIDFRGANLSAAVLNGAKLVNANLDGCKLNVSFLERADLSGATLRQAVLFSVQLKGGNLQHADLSGARLIGDLRDTTLTNARLTDMNAAADMKNQSMGLMRTNIVSAEARGADLSNSDFSRSDFSFTDFSDAKLVGTQLYRADFSGARLIGADLTGADLRDATLIDADLTGANLSNADLTGANFRGVRGLDTAMTNGARGLPR